MSFKKIVLKSTTAMSLNERFTFLRGNFDHGIQAIRENNSMQQQASAKNRRLAQQMERRPAVMAALKLKKWSLRQRLGQPAASNIKERLTLPTISQGSIRGRGRGLGRGIVRGRGQVRNFGSSLNLRENSNSSRFRRGQGRTFQPTSRRPFKRGVFSPRGMRGARFNRGNSTTSQRGSNTSRVYGNSFRRAGRSGVRGRGRGGSTRGRQQKLPSKEELDLQLDQYMANTKSHLDKELDSYMNQTSTENWKQ